MSVIFDKFYGIKQEYQESFNKNPDRLDKIVMFCALAFFQGLVDTALSPVVFVFSASYSLVVSVVSIPFSIFNFFFGGTVLDPPDHKKEKIDHTKKPIDIKTEDNQKFIQYLRNRIEATKNAIENLKEGDDEDPLTRDLLFQQRILETFIESGKKIYTAEDEKIKELETLLKKITFARDNAIPLWMRVLGETETPKEEETIEIKKVESKTLEKIEIKEGEDDKKIKTAPVHFKNNSNRCYFNSTMQSLLAAPYFRQQIRHFNPDNWVTKCDKEIIKFEQELFAVNTSESRKLVLKEDIELINRKYIAGAIIINLMKELLDSIESKKGNHDEIMNKIRQQMFEGGMHPEFCGSVTGQYDASAAFQTLFDVYDIHLPYKTVSQRTGEEVITRIELEPFLALGAEGNTFQELIDDQFSECVVDNSVIKDDVLILEDKTKCKNSVDLGNQEPPPMLVIQLKRKHDAKDNKQIPLPEDFKIDLAKVFNREEKIGYQLRSVVYRPSGSQSGGHYISRVCHEGQWYNCDDCHHDVEKIDLKEVKPEDGYMFVFERVE